jgi:D-inositol-3-phosphate glycosyltransferase
MNVYIRSVVRSIGARGVPVDIFGRMRHDESKGEVIALGHGARLIRLPAGPVDAPMDSALPWVESFSERVIDFARSEGVGYRGIVSQYWLSGLVGDRLRERWAAPHLAGFHTLALAKSKASVTESPAADRVAGERKVVARADGLLAATQHESDVLTESYDAERRKIHLAPPGVDRTRFRPRESLECRRWLGLPLDRQVVLFAGRMVPLKGVDVLLRALAGVGERRKISAVIVGGVVGSGYHREMTALAERLGLAERVRFTGWVPHELLPFYYGAADVCALPSYYESFGMVALEAMACGRPVVASRVGGLESLMRDSATGLLVRPGSIDDCRGALEEMLGNPRFRDDAGAAGVRAAGRFTWKATAEDILSAMEDVANRRSAS